MCPSSRDDIEVAIICALPREVNAVEALLDETYSRLCNGHMKDYRDVNVYTIGRMGKHNIVVCPLPHMGKVNAAVAATNLRFSFPNIRLALLVGICGGVPVPSGGAPEIFLGDVLISDSMIEYDVGRQHAGGFHRTSRVRERLGGPSQEIRTLLSSLASREVYSAFEEQLNKHLEDIQALNKKWLCPGFSRDVIFEESNLHRNGTIGRHRCTCASGNSVNCPRHGCEETHPLRLRSSENSDHISVHIGTFGCADRVMKSAQHRDLLARTEGVLAVEMEGAGVWDNLPSVIIKGVCDYADSNKHKVWQNYAAATAAAAAKAFLACWPPGARAGK
jgi:nucleoside phosphorylase